MTVHISVVHSGHPCLSEALGKGLSPFGCRHVIGVTEVVLSILGLVSITSVIFFVTDGSGSELVLPLLCQKQALHLGLLFLVYF